MCVLNVLPVWAALFLAGCACKPGQMGRINKYEIEVSLDEGLKNGNVKVDLIGVNQAGVPSWEAYSMREYWQDGDPRRKDADKVTLDLSAGKPTRQTLALTDDKWKQWQGRVTHVLVLADLPGGHVDKPGTQDARRKILPLGECSWPAGTKKLSVLIKQTDIEIVTPPRPVK